MLLKFQLYKSMYCRTIHAVPSCRIHTSGSHFTYHYSV